MGAFTRSCLDLKKIEKDLDKALEKETSESLTKWITDLRQKGFQGATKEEIDSIRIKSYTYAF